MTTRIYRVDPDHADQRRVNTGAGGTRLVRAANASQVWSYIASSQYLVGAASQDDLATLVAAGVQVETAGQEQDAA